MNIDYNGMFPVADEEVIEKAVKAYIEEHISGTSEITVHTEDSREEAAREYIEENAWAFNTWFIADYTSDGVTTEIIEILQEKCEGANEAILQLIEGGLGIDAFVEDAIQYDGYGHFLSGYDGEEHEIVVDGEVYYIYAN